MEHGGADVPYLLLKNFGSNVFIGNPHHDCSFFQVGADVQLVAFAPHEVQHALDRLIGRHFRHK